MGEFEPNGWDEHMARKFAAHLLAHPADSEAELAKLFASHRVELERAQALVQKLASSLGQSVSVVDDADFVWTDDMLAELRVGRFVTARGKEGEPDCTFEITEAPVQDAVWAGGWYVTHAGGQTGVALLDPCSVSDPWPQVTLSGEPVPYPKRRERAARVLGGSE